MLPPTAYSLKTVQIIFSFPVLVPRTCLIREKEQNAGVFKCPGVAPICVVRPPRGYRIKFVSI